MGKKVCNTHCLLSILMLSSAKWVSCCRVSHSQHIIWLRRGICIIHSLPNIWSHGLVMWNRIIVLYKYRVLNESNTKFLLKRDPVLLFPSSKSLHHSHPRVLLDKHCTAGLTDISAYSGTHFGRSLQLKRTHYVENKSVCPSVFPFVSQSVYLSACLSVDI
jgi:hypothetical protein